MDTQQFIQFDVGGDFSWDKPSDIDLTQGVYFSVQGCAGNGADGTSSSGGGGAGGGAWGDLTLAPITSTSFPISIHVALRGSGDVTKVTGHDGANILSVDPGENGLGSIGGAGGSFVSGDYGVDDSNGGGRGSGASGFFGGGGGGGATGDGSGWDGGDSDEGGGAAGQDGSENFAAGLGGGVGGNGGAGQNGCGGGGGGRNGLGGLGGDGTAQIFYYAKPPSSAQGMMGLFGFDLED